MSVNKRKKNTRMRAKTTHGYGSMKKNRGAGNRGGRGMAGSGKRADQIKPTILKNMVLNILVNMDLKDHKVKLKN